MKYLQSALLATVMLACLSAPGAARYYEPSTGRFLEEDPIYHPGQSSYEYALSNPLKYTDPTGTDVLLIRWGYGELGHQEVWVGNDASGYSSFGFRAASLGGGVLSAGTGLTVNGRAYERSGNLYAPWATRVPIFGYDLYGRISQGPTADAEFLAYARALGPQWARYSAYGNNCQDYAQTLFGRALQNQTSR